MAIALSLAGVSAPPAVASAHRQAHHSAPGSTGRNLFRDGFELGDFSVWNQVQASGTGKAVVESAIKRTGSHAILLSERGGSKSEAYVRRSLPGRQADLTVSGAFRVLQQAGGRVPLLRLLDSRSRRIAGVYRDHQTIGVEYARGHISTRAKLAGNRWGAIKLHVVARGRRSLLELWLNSKLIYRSPRANLAREGTSSVQIGDDSGARRFRIVADEIVVRSRGPSMRTPVNRIPPSLAGLAQEHQAMVAGAGAWGGRGPMAYQYQWLRCAASGSGCRPIASAAGNSYRVRGADVGGTLRIAVTATNPGGSTIVRSGPSAVVQSAAATPANVSLPTISEMPGGQTVTANPGAWTGTEPISFSYQWLRCNATGTGCGPITGAVGTSDVLVPADVGHTRRVTVRASNRFGSAAATSKPSAVIKTSEPPPELVALWHMDEASGTIMADSIGGHNGTLIGGITAGVPGVAGTAYKFDGRTGYVSVPSAAALNPGSKDITVTIHLQTSGTPPAPPKDWDVMRKGTYSKTSGEYKLELEQSGQAECSFGGSHHYATLATGPKLNDGQWHTVQCVKTSSAIELIADGQIFEQQADVGAINNTAPIVIGSRPGADYYNGALDEASVEIG